MRKNFAIAAVILAMLMPLSFVAADGPGASRSGSQSSARVANPVECPGVLYYTDNVMFIYLAVECSSANNCVEVPTFALLTYTHPVVVGCSPGLGSCACNDQTPVIGRGFKLDPKTPMGKFSRDAGKPMFMKPAGSILSSAVFDVRVKGVGDYRCLFLQLRAPNRVGRDPVFRVAFELSGESPNVSAVGAFGDGDSIEITDVGNYPVFRGGRITAVN